MTHAPFNSADPRKNAPSRTGILISTTTLALVALTSTTDTGGWGRFKDLQSPLDPAPRARGRGVISGIGADSYLDTPENQVHSE